MEIEELKAVVDPNVGAGLPLGTLERYVHVPLNPATMLGSVPAKFVDNRLHIN
jgi:hypothetical protein